MKKLSVVFVIALLVLSVSAFSFAQGTLKVATEAGFMPLEYVGENGELLGFDMDLIRAIGEKLDMEVKIDNISWDGLIPALLNNSYDVVIAGVTITDERAEAVNFSDPYFESVLTIVTKENDSSVTGLDSLAGKIAAVQLSTTGDFVAQDTPGIKDILGYNTVPEAMQNVIMGVADVVVVDLPVAQAYLEANPNAPLKHVGPVADNEFYGIALNKNNTTLLEEINNALAELKSDGTYDEIYQKWFGVEN